MSASADLPEMHLTIEDIRKYLHSGRKRTTCAGGLTLSAVLILLFERDGELYVVLTRRTDEVEHHKGQVSFPGGVRDPVDADIVDTALREAQEEIGIGRQSIEVVGRLNDYSTPSGFCITPIVGFIGSVPSYTINSHEVSEVFDVPLSFFLNRSNERLREHRTGSGIFTVYSYIYGSHEIWGATAAILRSFLYESGIR
jgi:8-oxo-dGTP pyrophosphatase MutT (NUDIX family)